MKQIKDLILLNILRDFSQDEFAVNILHLFSVGLVIFKSCLSLDDSQFAFVSDSSWITSQAITTAWTPQALNLDESFTDLTAFLA